MERKIFLAAEVAAQLRCTRRHIYDLFDEGELEGFRLGKSSKHIRFYADSVDDFVVRNSKLMPPPVVQQGFPTLVSLNPKIKPPTPPTASPSSRPRSGRPAPPPVGYRHLRPRTARP